MLLPSNQNFHGGDDIDNNEGLSELLKNIDEYIDKYTTTEINAGKRITEDQYIQETIETVETVGRFSNINSKTHLAMISDLK